MDIKLEKKPWYIRYRYYLTGGLLFISFLIYVIVLSLGPRKLRVDAENIQIAEVKEDNLSAINLYKKFNFQEIGRYPQMFNVNQKYYDALLMNLYID